MQDFLKTNRSQAVRDKLGEGLTRLFFFQLFRVQALHADPHPGNYLFNNDGTIGLVDYGCVKYLKPEVVPVLRAVLVAPMGVRPQTLRRNHPHNLRPKNFPGQTPRPPVHGAVSNASTTSFILLTPPNRSTSEIRSSWMTSPSWPKILLKNKFLSPEFLFLSRTESGMCNLLHILKARVRTTQIARQWMPKT